MRAEADQARLFAIMFAAQLADVQFLANAAHFGKPRIADMAAVRPDDGLGLRSLCSKQQFDGFDNMRFDPIPALPSAMLHHTNIKLATHDEEGVLLCFTEVITTLTGTYTPVGDRMN